jgi:tricorn protease
MRSVLLALAALAVCRTALASTFDAHDTRLLEQPDIDEQHVVFAYDDDLWIAGARGGDARRLTSAPGKEFAPHLSADGSLVAYSGEHGGNIDAYVVPVNGGTPTRLTWHGGPDTVQGFMPDGRVLFSSYRLLHTDRMTQLFAVSVAGEMPERIAVPDGDDARVAPDGSSIAYTTMPPLYKSSIPQAANYRGGDASRIWIMELARYGVQAIPQPPQRCNDLNPVWLHDRLYFSSDRQGLFNLYSFDPRTQQIEQLTHYEDHPILNLNGGGHQLVYEQAGSLHVFDPQARRDRRLIVGAAAERRALRARHVSDASYVRAVTPSPTLDQVALEYRGEIVLLPLERGATRNLTRSTAANDRSPAWSADGKHIAWFSDRSGEYALYIAAADGSGSARRIDLHGAGFYEDLQWSPDGSHLSYRDNSRSLYVVDARSARERRIAQEPQYSSSVTMKHAWSPDSRWLAYTVHERGMLMTVQLYSLREERSFRISDPLVDTGEPVFDAGGQSLYVAASIDAGPVRDWFTQSRSGIKMTRTLYCIPLTPERFTDAEWISAHAIELPDTAGAIHDVQAGRAGEVFYLTGTPGDAATLMHYSLAARRLRPLLEQVSEYHVAHDGHSVVYKQRDRWLVTELGSATTDAAGRPLPLDRVSVLVEPEREWQQILRESWRIKRDYFYASNYHGVDWDEVWKKYQPLSTHAATRADVARIQYWMSTELAVGHSYVFPGETFEHSPSIDVGLLGADFDIANGRYRFSKIYDAHWTAGVAAPLRAAGVEVSVGEYLLKVGDVEVTASADIYKYFQGVAHRPVALTVGPLADGRDARVITVTPIEDEMMLRRLDWIENNIRRVDAATNGRVAYVYVPDTASHGLALFKRYFYPQSHKEALILDARWNGGGSYADAYVDILRRQHVGRFATRYGVDQPVPRGAILGPKVLITNKMARSGGDLLAYSFRKLALGPIVGTTTTGALVGNLGAPLLMDAGRVTAPNFAFWNETEGWAVENEGVQPDIDVEQWPAALNAGHDPQLEKAIDTALSMLPAVPAAAPDRPAYPVRARRHR